MQHETDTTTSASTSAADDYDSPWKEAIEHHFPEFMAFYFPQAYSQIDWSKGYDFLEQELRAIVRDASKNGYRFSSFALGVAKSAPFTRGKALPAPTQRAVDMAAAATRPVSDTTVSR